MATNKTITQRIALEGSEEIRRQLQGLGGEASKAFKDVKAAADSVRGSVQPLPGEFKKVSEAAKKVGEDAKAVVTSFKDVALGVTAVVGALTAVGTAFGAAALGAAAAADEATKSAQRLGLTVKEFGRLRFAFRQSGLEAAQFELAMNRLNEEIIKTRDTTEQTNLRKLGIAVKGINGQLRPTSEILADLADRFQALPDGAEKSALAIDLFGARAGPRLIPFLNEGRAGLAKLGDEAERLGLVFDDAQAKIGQETQDAFEKLGDTIAAFRNKVFITFGPLLTEIFNTFAEVVASLRPPFEALARSITTYVTPVVREFLAAFKGEDSKVVTTWIQGVVGGFRLIADVVKLSVQIAGAALSGLITILDQVAKAINALFGTNFTGTQILVAAAILKVVGAFTLLVNVLKLVQSSWLLLNAVFTASPIGRIILIVAALGAALVLLYKNSDEVAKAIQTAWDAAVKWFAARLTDLQKYFSDLWPAIQERINQFFADAQAAFLKWLTDIGVAIVQYFTEAFDSVLATVRGWFDSIVGYFGQLIARAKQVANAIKSVFSSAQENADGGGIGAFAGGGRVRGPGSSTSDSIPAWLSNGEFVIKAAAVRKYGAALFAALNGMRLPKDGLGFSGGGMVDALSALSPVRGFANGGLVGAAVGGGGRPFTLNIDGHSFGGLTASDSVADQLERFAMNRAIRSAGRKPAWYRG